MCGVSAHQKHVSKTKEEEISQLEKYQIPVIEHYHGAEIKNLKK